MKHRRTDSFVFRREYYEYFKTLSDEDFLFCMKALCYYAFDCVEIPEHQDPSINEHLKAFCSRVDEDIWNYQKRCDDGK